MRMILAAAVAATALLGASAANATSVPSGTVTADDSKVPSVTYGGGTGMFNANDATFETDAEGGLSNAYPGTGLLKGVLSFSLTDGATVTESLPSFFTFTDGSAGGTLSFAVSSVTTGSFAASSNGKDVAGTLYLSGDTSGGSFDYASTPTSVTLQFNKTGGSGYQSGLTLSIPPVGSAPEPGAWILMIAGVGLAGVAFRRSRQVRAGQIA